MSFFKLKKPYDELGLSELKSRLENNSKLENFLFRPDRLDKDSLEHQYKIKDKTFRNVSFSKTELRELEFENCIFEDCRFIDSVIVECWFHNCEFIRTNPYKFSVYNSYLPPAAFKKALDKSDHQNIGVLLYQSLMRNARGTDQPKHEADAHFQFLRWKRFQTLYEIGEAKKGNPKYGKGEKSLYKLRSKWIGSLLFETFIGSGIRLQRYVATAAGLVLFFFIVNLTFQKTFGLLCDSCELGKLSASETLYFTIISLTTVGYGDIAPTTTCGHYWISFQSVVGFVMFATLASMLFRKIAP